MLFNKKHRGIVNVIWGIVAFMVIASMILLYFPVFQ